MRLLMLLEINVVGPENAKIWQKIPKELFEGISPSFHRSQGRIGIDREFTMNR